MNSSDRYNVYDMGYIRSPQYYELEFRRRRCGRAFKGANEPAASPEGKVVGSSPGLRQTQSKLVVRKISAIRARVFNG